MSKPDGKTAYHHGDLRNALLSAAESELRDRGIEKFSLRGVARKADVSHAAPAHHFVDTKGLLTALATIGFERFLEAMLRRQDKDCVEPIDRLTAAGLGYIDFSQQNPELFELMFSSRLGDADNLEFQVAGRAAFDHLVMLVDEVKGVKTEGNTNHDNLPDVYAAWAMVHGLSSLLNAGFLIELGKDSNKTQEDIIKSILMRYLNIG